MFYFDPSQWTIYLLYFPKNKFCFKSFLMVPIKCVKFTVFAGADISSNLFISQHGRRFHRFHCSSGIYSSCLNVLLQRLFDLLSKHNLSETDWSTVDCILKADVSQVNKVCKMMWFLLCILPNCDLEFVFGWKQWHCSSSFDELWVLLCNIFTVLYNC